MVAEDGQHGDMHGRSKVRDELLRFLGQPVVGQIATKNQNVGTAGNFSKVIVKDTARVFSVMNVGGRGDAQFSLSHLSKK